MSTTDFTPKWYDQDWFVCLNTAVGLLAMIAANIIFHGGRLIW